MQFSPVMKFSFALSIAVLIVAREVNSTPALPGAKLNSRASSRPLAAKTASKHEVVGLKATPPHCKLVDFQQREDTWANCTIGDDRTQNRTLELYKILLDADHVLERLNVDHSLFGGTLLAQMRTGTMNPWEVDNDILLTDPAIPRLKLLGPAFRMFLCIYDLVAFDALGVVRVCRRHPDPPAPKGVGAVGQFKYLYTDIYDLDRFTNGLKPNVKLRWGLSKVPLGDEGAMVWRMQPRLAAKWLAHTFGEEWRTTTPGPGTKKRGMGPVPMPGITPDWVAQEYRNTTKL